MAGVSEMPFRLLARELGAVAAPTELVSAKGLIRGQGRSHLYLRHSATERPFWVQIFGGDPDEMAAGAERAVEQGAEIIDINMGCPVRKITRKGAGSALLADPTRAAAIVTKVRERVDCPVTAKIRMGWEQANDFLDMAKALEDAGAAAIAMHARTRIQGYEGAAQWEAIARLVHAVHIPVFGNGDASTPEKAIRMREVTGCAGVMIGRGALGNPWIFSALSRRTPHQPTTIERARFIVNHFAAHIAFTGDAQRAVRRFRQHLRWYAQRVQGGVEFASRWLREDDAERVRAAMAEFFTTALTREGEAVTFDTKSALG